MGAATSRERPLAKSAQAIRLSTIEWPETISITMMKAVIGPCVVAARKPTIPRAMSGIAAAVRIDAREQCDVVPHAGTDGQRRSKHAGRQARPGREPGGTELQKCVDTREVGLAFQHGPRRRVAGAGRGPLRDDADERYRNGAGRAKPQRVVFSPAGDSTRRAARGQHDQTGKQATTQTRCHGHEQAGADQRR